MNAERRQRGLRLPPYWFCVHRSSFCVALFSVALLLSLASPARAVVNLRVVETRHYRVHTDLDRDLADDLVARLDGMYDEYDRRLAEFKRDDGDAPLDAYLLKSRDEYVEYGGTINLRFTAGCYIPDRDILAAFLGAGGRDELRKTLQHEAFHQFANHTIGGGLPSWINEGLAQWFEEGLWAGDHFLLGQVPPMRLRRLAYDVGQNQLIPFDKLLLMSNGRWNLNMANEQLGQLQYNQSWAMVQFLIDARDGQGRPRYRARLTQLLRLVHAGRTGDEAFRAAFSDNIAGFHDRFMEYVSTLKPSREAMMVDRQKVLGEFVAALDRHKVRVNTIAELRQAVISQKLQLTARIYGMRVATEADPSVYLLDPDGQPLGQDQLYFQPDPHATMPDLVCRFGAPVQIRTRFYPDGERTDCEVLTETAP